MEGSTKWVKLPNGVKKIVVAVADDEHDDEFPVQSCWSQLKDKGGRR